MDHKRRERHCRVRSGRSHDSVGPHLRRCRRTRQHRRGHWPVLPHGGVSDEGILRVIRRPGSRRHRRAEGYGGRLVADRLSGGDTVLRHVSPVLDFSEVRDKLRQRRGNGGRGRAAGIGFDLFMASGFYFDLHEVGLITYGILATAVILEVAATRIKTRLKDK